MSGMIFSLGRNAIRMIKVNKPTIYIGSGVAGLIAAGVMAVKATPDALDDIKEAENDISNYGPNVRLDTRTIVKVTWKRYLPSMALAAGSTLSIMYGTHINNKRLKALTAAYSASERAYTRYRDVVRENVGKKKAQEIDHEVKKAKNEEFGTKGFYIPPGEGNVLFREEWEGDLFRLDIETVRHIANDINKRLTSGMEDWVSINEFRYAVGLKATKLAEDRGFTPDCLIEIDPLTPVMNEDPNTKDLFPTVILVDSEWTVRYDYRMLM